MTEQNPEKYGNDEPIERKENPSLYGEEKLMHDISTMSDAVLDAKAQRFIGMLNDPTTLPAHKKHVAKLLDYIAFETAYRHALMSGERIDQEMLLYFGEQDGTATVL